MSRRPSGQRSHTEIQVFRTAARLSSFTRAALELGVPPTAVSRQIRVLEEKLGSRLFVRHPRRVELTPKGRELSLITNSNADAAALRSRKADPA